MTQLLIGWMEILFLLVEFSVKQEKHSTRTLSLVICTQSEILKKPAKQYISIQRGMKLRKPSILVLN
jgi:hypothetical protein